MPESRTVLRGGTIVDGAGSEPRVADLAIRGNTIEAVGTIVAEPTDTVIDVSGRYLLPGFIDAHSHADAAVFSAEVQRGLLRQGVTTVIVGQDGVSYAPGDGGYASEYFAALNGPHPSYTGGGVAALLASYDEATPVNVGYLVPAGTVRHEVRGYTGGPSTPAEIAAMSALVAQGLDDGALGLSTGLDYVPNILADTDELIALCRPVAAAGAIYVTHMRGGYEEKSRIGIEEVDQIARATGVSVHVSHYHGPSDLLIGLAGELSSHGIDMTFDAYPYRRGCSLLAMPILPPALLSGPRAELVATLSDPAVRANLLGEWFTTFAENPLLGPEWADNLTFAHIAAGEYAWAHGRTISAAAAQVERDPASFALDVLVASSLEVSTIMTVRNQRSYDELAELFTHPSHIAGSDGIYVGAHPHPRAWGTFAKFLRLFTRERGDFSWPDVAVHLAGRAAERFGLSDRGRLWPGYVADVVVVDPTIVGDISTYDAPRADAVGIDDVFVAGQQVLADGRLTGVLSGRGLRRTAPVR
ncbi:MAG: N-acyl-D-glutamate deacylase [Leifsonia sp.]|jgi:N-acyl-D-amino-acid deacylase|nr:N-acyl-D-glutamate deacylase [Leifsonia sp.]MDQ1587270.1 N-acyl-D-amino-acid deacylase [Microbacteriaceae bacterium]